jgi:hypothetical protein
MAIMKDAYGNKLKLGDQIIYSTGGSSGTRYSIGKIVELHPSPPDTGQFYRPPDRVSVKVTKTSGNVKIKSAILYASNVVLIKKLK